jgi:hypothetical protein
MVVWCFSTTAMASLLYTLTSAAYWFASAIRLNVVSRSPRWVAAAMQGVPTFILKCTRTASESILSNIFRQFLRLKLKETGKVNMNLFKTAVAVAIVCSVFFLSGCALFWLGAGGAGGYLIRKGEEGGEVTTRKTAPESSKVTAQKTSAY